MFAKYWATVPPAASRARGRSERSLTSRGARIGVLVLLGGCTVTSEAPISFTLEQTPLVEPLPLKVGFQYSEDFVEYKYVWESPESFEALMETLILKPGPGSVAMFSQALAAQFEQVVDLSGPPPWGERYSGLTAVVRPNIARFTYNDAVIRTSPIRTLSRTRVTYRLELLDNLGQQFLSSAITGSGAWDSEERAGSETSLIGFLPARHYAAAATNLALRNTAAKLFVSFEEERNLRQCLDEALSSSTQPNQETQ